MNDASRRWFERARRVLPGGVNSPVRAFQAVGGRPRVIRNALGPYLFDEDGQRMIDYIGSWGAMIAGHAHPAVTAAIERAARDGASFGACHRNEVLLAEAIARRVPSVEQLRLVNSGTEAVMSAVRLARAATGRPLLIKFAGGYHGHADALLAEAGSGLAQHDLPASAGVPPTATAHTVTLPYNDLEAVADFLRARGAEVGALIVEPVAGNMGVVPPADGFLGGLRALADAAGALLIFDEVMTGFRVAPGGAQQLYGVTPDLTTLGKVIGGGLPVGALGGRRDLLQLLSPAGPVYQAGTMSGNPVATAAGLATLELLTDDAWAALERRGAQLEQGLVAALASGGVTGCVQRVGAMLTVFLGTGPVRNFDDARRADRDAFARLFHGLLERGVHLPPSPYEAWFPSLAHDESVIEETLAAARGALTALRHPEPTEAPS